jgi:hypothetical protein
VSTASASTADDDPTASPSADERRVVAEDLDAGAAGKGGERDRGDRLSRQAVE